MLHPKAYGTYPAGATSRRGALAHRQRHCVLSDYFQHVLELPVSYHGDVHSGRLMKVMLQGTDSLWGLWVGFFRDHLSGFIMFFVLLPLSLLMIGAWLSF